MPPMQTSGGRNRPSILKMPRRGPFMEKIPQSHGNAVGIRQFMQRGYAFMAHPSTQTQKENGMEYNFCNNPLDYLEGVECYYFSIKGVEG